MSEDSLGGCRLLAAESRQLAALSYVANAHSNTPDYWGLPASGGYAAGYAEGIEMAGECADYLTTSTTPDAELSEEDGWTHLLRVIRRITERTEAAKVVAGAARTSEAYETLRGHLAGFCSGVEWRFRRLARRLPQTRP